MNEAPKASGGADTSGKDIDVEEVTEKLGGVRQMGERDRARLTMAYAILGSVLLLFLLAAATLIFAPADRREQAQLFFEFAKTFGPPIVTLVIGFYFRNDGE